MFGDNIFGFNIIRFSVSSLSCRYKENKLGGQKSTITQGFNSSLVSHDKYKRVNSITKKTIKESYKDDLKFLYKKIYILTCIFILPLRVILVLLFTIATIATLIFTRNEYTTANPRNIINNKT